MRYVIITCLALNVALARADSTATVPAAGEQPFRRAPRVIEIADDTLPKPELLATPEVRALLGYTRRLLRLPDGHTFGVFSYSIEGPANWLFLIDGRDISSQRYAIPNNDHASHGSDLGKDGNIYTMPYGNGRVYRFDMSTRTFETVKVEVPAEERSWEAFTASSGRVYFGTYPSACLGEYDPATKRSALFKQVVDPAKYVTNLDEDEQGRIRFRASGPGEVWMQFDPRTRQLARIEKPEPKPASRPVAAPPAPPLPAPPEGDEKFSGSISVDGRQFAISFPSGRFWEAEAGGKLRLLGDTREPAVSSWWLERVPGGVVGISYFGALIRYDLKTGEFVRKELANRAPGGNSIMFLESVTPHCVIGASYSQQNLFRIDPETGRVEESPTVIARVTGEPMCAIGFNGLAYIGIYVQAILSVYDPAQSFAYGKNPRELIELGTKYEQVRPRDTATDGKLVFISSDATYNQLGGALTVIDPATGKIDVYHQLVHDQNLPTLAYDPAGKLLWGGTDRWGQMHSHPPTQESSVLYAFDPHDRKVVQTLCPFKGADVTAVLGILPNGVLIASGGEEVATIDTRTREILYRGPAPIAKMRKIRRAANGESYFLANGKLYRWDVAENTLTPVARLPGGLHLTEPTPNTWLIGDNLSVYRLRLAAGPPKEN